MIRLLLAALALFAALTPLSAAEPAPQPVSTPAPLAALVEKVDIPFAQFRLANGLSVVVHTDRKAPLVHVGVWYHVGSRDEPMGRSGFAHLFEHIMFRGSAHSRQDHFRPLEDAGATDFNGTTDFERTNYFQTVPTPALELALFLESDRMGWLLPALTQPILESERAIVLNEKRQGENAPGGLVFPALLRALYPPSHPFSVPAIGQEADLNAATLEDAKRWFRDHYGPNNAVLVLAGDIDAATARRLAQKWFGAIPPGPTPARFAAPLPDRAPSRETLVDKVANPRLIRAWAIPGRGTPGLEALDVGLATLGSGPTSLLFDRLVRQERLAVAVSAGLSAWEGAGIASITVDVAPGVDPAKAEARADALLTQWLRDGPSAEEVERVAVRVVGGTIRGLEKVGGFGGKGVALAEGLLFAGDPADYKRELAAIAAATPADVKAAAARFLQRGDHRILLLPGPRDPASVVAPQAPRQVAAAARPPASFMPIADAVDRTAGLPPVGEISQLVTPPVERTRLANGIDVVFARQAAVPVVRLSLSLPVGVAGDSRAAPGTQRLLLALLRDGSAGALGPMDGPEIARRLERLGAAFAASQGLDRTQFGLNALSLNLAASVALFADLVQAPTFDPVQLERVRGQVLASIAAEEANPNGLAGRALPALLYGPGHPFGQSFSGSGTADGVRAVTRDALIAFHQRHYGPVGATIFAVGDTSLAELKPLLERHFGRWRPGWQPPPLAAPPAPAPAARGRIILYDRPGAPQSVILAGAPLPLTGRDDTLPLRLANDLFGGLTTSRLNRLLREEKGWSYGAFSGAASSRLELPFQISAPVETPRTGESIAAIRQLLAEVRGPQPLTAAEADRARASLVRGLPGDFETAGALMSALERNLVLGRPDDYLATLPARTMALPLDAIRAAPLPAPDDLVFVVVGDRAAVEPQLSRLGLPVEVRATPAAAAAGPAPRG